MVYQEVSWMEVDEVVRRAQAGDSQRSIARALGLARNTVAAISVAPSWRRCPARLGGGDHQDRPAARRPPSIASDRTPSRSPPGSPTSTCSLTRIQELLAQHGTPVAYTTLRRFLRQAGLWKPAPAILRIDPKLFAHWKLACATGRLDNGSRVS